MKPVMNVAIAINAKYVRYAYVMLSSLFSNNKNSEICVYILHGESLENGREILERLAEKYEQKVIFIKINNDMLSKRLPLNSPNWTIEIYYRLMLPELLPECIDRILYLDVDMIVNGSLTELYTIDFEDKLFCVCKDMSAKNGLTDIQNRLFTNLLSQGGFTYFNSGMMLWNIEKIRGKVGFHNYMQLIEKLDYEISAPDQDLLNYMHWNQIKLVDEECYDLFARLAYNEGKGYDWVKENVTIIHFAGHKPWQAEALRYSTEQLWWDYAKISPFYTEMLEELVYDSIQTNFMDNYVKNILNENNQLRDKLNKCMEIFKKMNI